MSLKLRACQVIFFGSSRSIVEKEIFLNLHPVPLKLPITDPEVTISSFTFTAEQLPQENSERHATQKTFTSLGLIIFSCFRFLIWNLQYLKHSILLFPFVFHHSSVSQQWANSSYLNLTNNIEISLRRTMFFTLSSSFFKIHRFSSSIILFEASTVESLIWSTFQKESSLANISFTWKRIPRTIHRRHGMTKGSAWNGITFMSWLQNNILLKVWVCMYLYE